MKPSLSLPAFVQIVLLILGVNASAQDAIVRSSLGKQEDRWVGQRIPLVVELLVPGYFSGNASFGLPDPPGILIIPPTGSPVVSSEDIGGVSYTLQRYELAVFSRRVGDQTIPEFPIRFSYKRQPLDKDSVPATGKTEPLHFTTRLPPGAEKLGSVISARGLQVVEVWKPQPGRAKAGDAFTRTVTFTAPEVPAMAFPPFPAARIEGLGIYPKPPEVLDRSERGELSGKRVDSITYVCQRPGQFTIPASRLTWFDLDSKELRTIEFPDRVLDVAPNPALASSAAASHEPDWKPLTWSALISGALALAALYLPRTRLREWGRRTARLFRPVHLPPLNPTQNDHEPS